MVMRGTDMKIAEASEEDLTDFNTDDAYARWLERERVKFIVDFAFDGLSEIDLEPWDRKGGSGAVINIPSDHLTNDAHVVEIKAGGSSEPEHHLYDEFCYTIAGAREESPLH